MKFILLLMMIASCQRAPADQEERIQWLGTQLRCPVCRGVPINESPSPMAAEMMTIVREQVAAGKSDDEILRFFADRYGEWALLKPKPEGMNLLVWILPFVFLGGGLIIIARHLRKRGP